MASRLRSHRLWLFQAANRKRLKSLGKGSSDGLGSPEIYNENKLVERG